MKSAIEEAQKLVKTQLSLETDLSDWAPVPDSKMGDFAIPCFKLAKLKQSNPQKLASDLAVELTSKVGNSEYLSKLQSAGPYLNFFIKSDKVFQALNKESQDTPGYFGSHMFGKNKSIVIDYSSPNIAKEVGLHHLRSTAIGDSLARIAEHQGYKVIRLNYLGDWGTTHGKLISALKSFGDEAKLESEGLGYMLELYVRFNKEEKEKPELSQEAKLVFKKLEDGDPYCRRTWKLFRDISVREFKKLYEKLDIHFDFYDGESLYEKKIDPVMEELRSKIGTRISDGAEVLDLPNFKTPVLLKKDDGASLYITRDIAAAQDRYERFHFDEAWYVVAIQQKLHFEQLFKIVELLKKDYQGKLIHIPFGMLSFGTKTMKSREGNVIFLEDVLEESKKRALAIIQEKNSSLPDAEKVAEMVGYGAIKFFDLSQNRNHDISFSWEKALNFEGDTGPFIQYTHARICSLIQKAKLQLNEIAPSYAERALSGEIFEMEAVRQLTKDLGFFAFSSSRAFKDKDPSQIATSLINISRSFNHFYHSHRLKDETNPQRLHTLIELCSLSSHVLKLGLALLGISAPERM